MQKSRSENRFIWVGGHPCLDFVNTELMQGKERGDLLEEFASLVAWLQAAGRLNENEERAILDRWNETPPGELALRRARALRSVLREMVAGIVAGKPVSQTAVDEINRLLKRPWGHPRVVKEGDHFQRLFHADPAEPMDLLVPLAEAAADLLCDRDLSLVKACGNPRCILYFYDTTKNRGRRWCSMEICGNRMKAAAHHQRRQSRPPG